MSWGQLVNRHPVVHALRWIPAFAAEHPSHWTNILGGKRPSEASLSTPLVLRKHVRGYRTNILGGMEEHLASRTKGCEGKKCSGEAPLSTPLALRKHVRGYWTNILGGNDGVQRE